METKFTPGPWVVRSNGSYFDIGIENDSLTIQVYPSVCIGVRHEDEANAHLIAAAPEMYEMLDTIRCFLNEDGLQTNGLSKEIAKIPELLDKARGE